MINRACLAIHFIIFTPTIFFMKLYRALFLKICRCLDSIFNGNEYADKTVQHLFKTDRQLGSSDRRLVAEAVYEIVRWKRLFAYAADIGENFEEKNLSKLIKVWVVFRSIAVPQWDDLAFPDEARTMSVLGNPTLPRAVRESIPDWMDNQGVEELGEKLWDKEISALNKPAEVILRANTLINSPEMLKPVLSKENMDTTIISGYRDALRLTGRTNVFNTKAYKDGRFEVQDASSQLIAPFLEVTPGMLVIDACAGAGGKSLHIAALLENKGRLVAMDVLESKLEKLKIRARRNKVHNIECRLIESSKTWKRFKGMADRVLIDAPCSGLGVLRRKPDDKWKLSPEKLESLRNTQKEILADYAGMVKPTGKLVYATCSVLPSENQDQVRNFLASDAGEGFRLEAEQIILASQSGFDGFYMARLVKAEHPDVNT
jgi:16S rRNA (cytosine967-C5)-methyltransferase